MANGAANVENEHCAHFRHGRREEMRGYVALPRRARSRTTHSLDIPEDCAKNWPRIVPRVAVAAAAGGDWPQHANLEAALAVRGFSRGNGAYVRRLHLSSVRVARECALPRKTRPPGNCRTLSLPEEACRMPEARAAGSTSPWLVQQLKVFSSISL